MYNYDAAEPETIRSLFDRIAHSYNLVNAITSMGVFLHWNATLARQAVAHWEEGPFLDLCCGKGDIALQVMKREPLIEESYLLDFSPQMLQEAEHRWNAKERGRQHIHFLQADAQQIPLPDESMGLVTQAYGIRNVQDPRRCMEEVWRVLRPGGCWAILELTTPPSKMIGSLYRLYLRLVLPLVGRVVSGDFDAYNYLVRSICHFMPPKELSNQLEEVGFELKRVRPLFFGAAHTWIAKKP